MRSKFRICLLTAMLCWVYTLQSYTRASTGAAAQKRVHLRENQNSTVFQFTSVTFYHECCARLFVKCIDVKNVLIMFQHLFLDGLK